ncbi:MAG: CotS family spore coat protein [Blautia sp.]
MYDYGLSVLEQYDVTVKDSCRGRGALLCHTDQGLLLIREFRGSEKKLGYQQELLLQIQKNQEVRVDAVLPNKEGGLVSCDSDGIPYVVRFWFEARECDTRSREDILRSVGALANVHKEMHLSPVADYAAQSLEDELDRHNRELRKIRKFVRQKRKKNEFEAVFLSSVDWFLERGEQALSMLKDSGYGKLRRECLEEGRICHGEFNQHNVLLSPRWEAITNFEHWSFDVQTADLYRFMRKILEKYNWEERLADAMLKAYDKVRPLSPGEWEDLKVRFCYPEKYWKLANYYYTHNKAWISGKTIEKLKKLVEQQETWEKFGKKMFS